MNLSAHPRWIRTALNGYLGVALLTRGAADLTDSRPQGWFWFVCGAAVLILLFQHLREQSLRGLRDPGATWSRTDTANVTVLALLTVFPLANVQFSAHMSPPEQATSFTLAALYAALLLDFTTLQRHQTVKASTQEPATPT